MKVSFFKSPADFRNWLQKHHASEQELWVGFYKAAWKFFEAKQRLTGKL